MSVNKKIHNTQSSSTPVVLFRSQIFTSVNTGHKSTTKKNKNRALLTLENRSNIFELNTT